MSGTTASGALADVLVIEWGGRIAAAVCSAWLAQLGATVIVVEGASQTSDKSRHRAQLTAGKLSFLVETPADLDLLQDLASRSDVIVTSSDVDDRARSPLHPQTSYQINCDITAFGKGGPNEGQAYSDAQMQALSGIVDTTGLDNGRPTVIPIPLLEYLAGMHASGACIAALRSRRRTGRGQEIDVALYDTGVAAISSFLTRSISDGNAGPTRRIGNRHSLSAPWNVYRASDGWVQICTGSDVQWKRLCERIGSAELADDTRFKSSKDRVANIDAVDGVVQAWMEQHTVEQCVELLNAANIPSGPIARIDGYPREDNLRFRNMVVEACGGSSRPVYLPGSPFRMSRTAGRSLRRIPTVGGDRQHIVELQERRASLAAASASDEATAPLSDIRVVEIGHYTTAPVAARYLAALGADVIKVEPPEGEASRAWPPLQAGQSLFYTLSNSDKRAVTIDLTTPAGQAKLRSLIGTADVLIENLKPGTLAKRGFSEDELLAINPRLVYCAISGFGAHSLYAGRAAFDTVVQAMSGLMDILKLHETPLKAGLSIADVMGASAGVSAILAALMFRDRSGLGQAIDLSMQDILAWSTQLAWNNVDLPRADANVLQCLDGAVLVSSPNGANSVPEDLSLRAAALPRIAFERLCRDAGIEAVPIRSPFEVLTAEQTSIRQLVLGLADDRGTLPILRSPLRLSDVPYRPRRAAPPLGAHNTELLGLQDEEAFSGQKERAKPTEKYA